MSIVIIKSFSLLTTHYSILNTIKKIMTPKKKPDEYTRYCITPEGKEYLRRMLEEKYPGTNESGNDNENDELNMDEEIDFEDLRIIDDDDDFEPDEDEILDNELLNDEFFRINEAPNDDDYDFWKENLQ